MSVRRVNYTGRRRIPQDRVSIVLLRPREGEFTPVTFDAALNLSGLSFPADARVTIDAYRQTTRQAFAFGTVSTLAPPINRSLEAFDSADAVLFRLRVTDSGNRNGVLLGEADRIRAKANPAEDSDRVPLLPPAPGDLGDQVWRLEIEGSPILRINERLSNWTEAVKSDQFRALVFPSALRDVYRHILSENVRSLEDGTTWQTQWLRFAISIPGVPGIPQSKDGDAEWIENVASAFSRRFGLLDRYQKDFFGQPLREYV